MTRFEFWTCIIGMIIIAACIVRIGLLFSVL